MFARNRRGHSSAQLAAGGVVRAARSGAGREIWIREALRELRSEPGSDRCGVWLEAPWGEQPSGAAVCTFRGEIFDSSDLFPIEAWSRLSLEPLPLGLLAVGKTVEFSQEEKAADPLMGPAMGMAHGSWTPVTALGALRGVLMLAAQRADMPLPRAFAERIAEELGLALEWEEQRRLAAVRKNDLEFIARIHQQLAGEFEADSLFREIVESCTRREQLMGIGAVFALIGEHRKGVEVDAPSGAAAADRLQIRALSGDAEWGHSVEHEPLGMFWRRALETRQMIGAEASALPLTRGIGRIVTLPLILEKRAQGVLLVGLPHGPGNTECVGRLELRSLLAAQALQKEARLAEQTELENWGHALLDSSEQPVVLVDRNGFFRGMSRGAQETLARESAANALRGENPTVRIRFAELFCQHEWERANQWGQASWEAQQAEGATERLRALLKDGTEVECHCLELTGKEFLAVCLRRTAEPRGERSKEDVEEELRQTIGWMEQGVILLDETGGIRAANERFHRLLGLTAEEATQARNLEDLVRLVSPHAQDPEHFARTWRALGELPEGETQEELQMSWPVAQSIERCTREIVAASGRRLGRVEVYRELNARRMFQSRMAQAEKLASLGQRVSGIVHELSNPLTTILGYAQRLLGHGREAEEAVRREMRGILDEAERATRILRQLLRFSGEARGAHEPLSLNEVVDRTVELRRPAFFGSQVRLVVEKEPGLPLFKGDFGEMQQVLLNLLQNAQQAIEQSGKGGLIGVRTTSAGEGRARLEVWDDGPGIPGAIQARIFDPFFTTKPPEVGTGLGLAIVLGLVRQHGGTVNVISPPRGGTRFLVELPAALPASRDAQAPSRRTRPAPGRIHRGKGRPGGHDPPKVLVVEDEPTVGGLIADVLREEGMRVDVLRDGHAALARAEAENYDLAICDLKLPGMDGQKFFHSLGQLRNPLQRRVLFVTGDVAAPRTQEFLERHGLPYVAKPFRVEELSRAVREML